MVLLYDYGSCFNFWFSKFEKMDLDIIKRYISKNVFTGVVKTIVNLLYSIIAIPYVITKIGLENYGIISLVLLFSSFAGVFDLGLSKALVVYGVNRDRHRKEISGVYLINFIIVLIISFLALVVYSNDINLMGDKINIDQRTVSLINMLALLQLALSVLVNLLRARLESGYMLNYVNIGFLVQTSIINTGWLFLAIFDIEMQYFLIIPLMSSFITGLYYIVVLPPKVRFIIVPDAKSVKSVFKLTTHFFGIGILNSIHLPLMKYCIILFIGEGRAIGIFELSTKLSLISNNFLSYVTNPLFSIAAKHKDESKLVFGIVIKLTLIVSLLALFGYIVYLIFSEYIIFYFFKENTREVFVVLSIILLGYLFVAISDGIQKFYLGIGKIMKTIHVKLLVLCINFFWMIGLFLLSTITLENFSLGFGISLLAGGIYWIFLLKQERRIMAELGKWL